MTDLGLLHCEHLCKRFNGVCALSDVTISFPRQGIVGLIGPNGAGKSTLLNLITGIVRSDSGRIRFCGREIGQLHAYEIARMGIARTFQDLRVARSLTVMDNILLACARPGDDRIQSAFWPGRMRKWERRHRVVAESYLDIVGLPDAGQYLAGELSYGQQKLLGLACCLATDASVLLLDEPVAGVHSEIAQRIGDVMNRLRSDGRLVVVIEHDIAFVRQFADTVLAMHLGQVLALGPAGMVLDKPEVLAAYMS